MGAAEAWVGRQGQRTLRTAPSDLSQGSRATQKGCRCSRLLGRTDSATPCTSLPTSGLPVLPLATAHGVWGPGGTLGGPAPLHRHQGASQSSSPSPPKAGQDPSQPHPLAEVLSWLPERTGHRTLVCSKRHLKHPLGMGVSRGDCDGRVGAHRHEKCGQGQ